MHETVRGGTADLLTGSRHLGNLERPATSNDVTGEFVARLTCAQ
jgi:hypothetical protein